MTEASRIKFVLSQGWGDYKNLWMMKYEFQKAFNGYLVDGIVQWQEVREGSNADVDGKDLIPFMKIIWGFPLQEMIDALTEKTAIIPTKQAEIDAELKATKFHLDDMRKLVFKKDENNTDSQ